MTGFTALELVPYLCIFLVLGFAALGYAVRRMNRG